MIRNHLLNLRPYSWVDLILLGFLAKFSIASNLTFAWTDFYLIASLLLLWFFFNFALEAKHNYSYRAKTSLYLPIICLILLVIVSLCQNFYSLIPLVISVLLVLVYLQKNRNAVLGNFSSLARGLIESLYFIYALLLFTNSINQQQILIAIFILLIYAARAVVGDIRDVKPNGEAGKKTFPVTFGVRASKILVILLLLITAAIQIISFNSCLMTMPLLLFALALIFYNNGYVLHQLMILTTSFFHINLISYYTEQNLIFINLIFLGILLNFIFYPLLKRKSNPQFVQE